MTTMQNLDTLIAFPTVSGTPNADLITWAEVQLEACGAQILKVAGPVAGTWNLFATLGPRDVRGILLSGHSDVVPVAEQDWTSDPFALTARGDRLYGRGTADMKGFLACALAAFSRAAPRRAELRAPLHLAITCEEEVGCVGVRTLLPELGRLATQPLLCIVGEPTSMRLATGHKGKLALRATCTGRAAHSALPMQGLNAIFLASEFIEAVRAEQARIEHEGVSDAAFEVPYSTLHVGTIRGGTALNIVPESCTVELELRSIPGEDSEGVFARLSEAAERIVAPHQDRVPEARIALEVVNSYPGLDSGEDPWLEFMTALTGTNHPIKLAFGTEGGLLDQAIDAAVVVCGPGSMDQGHKPDEFVTVDQLARCDAMLDAVIERLCRPAFEHD
ncbi:acetylornithine deacetylase [Novosphingobium chloroacetimidivorans]|uniref:Acetylornithine deacetylase n=1 Tax=Novosphingobium chloroacetimidivorans TaxID=1428314 RepID=A0A7W7NYX3_9SPHN|nr:acetylornithine deacetylase [Novosphingobium chloroacetimidivorans]MBB4860660.1 acetylornithine deacetylase [Novosphingobium chloroacetimidivorans]